MRHKKKGVKYQEFVASVVGALDSTVETKVEDWVDGPDGRRDRDVLVYGFINGKQISILIECKDFDPSKTGKVGVSYVDAIDSKRHDVGVDLAMICSNSGFTRTALNKAKRKRIGMISILKTGDKMVRNEISEEIYTRKISLGKIDISFRSNAVPIVDLNEVTYEEKPIRNWVIQRMVSIVAENQTRSGKLRVTHEFKQPISINFAGQQHEISGLDFEFLIETKWFSQIVTIDASLGIYDYIRGSVRLGANSTYIIDGVDIYGGKPINYIPNLNDLKPGLLPGEIIVDLMLFEKFDMPPKEEIPDLDKLIIQNDLSTKISNESLCVRRLQK